MRGKYSPTVNSAYAANRNWWSDYAGTSGSQYDPDGFDSYGYDANDLDRAGNNESAYYHNDALDDGYDQDYNYAYDSALLAWGFDGVKPVLRMF